MSTATRLNLYNDACRILKERALASTDDNREVKHLFDDAWDAHRGFVQTLLEHGLFNFSIQTEKLEATSTSMTFTHTTGTIRFDHIWQQSTDFVRLAQISANEGFSDNLTGYEEEQDKFYTNVDPVYIRWVSASTSYGGNFDIWPNSFSRFAAAWLAREVAGKLTSGAKSTDVEAEFEKRKYETLKFDALDEPARFQTIQSWNRARMGRSYGRRDRGSRSSLTG